MEERIIWLRFLKNFISVINSTNLIVLLYSTHALVKEEFLRLFRKENFLYLSYVYYLLYLSHSTRPKLDCNGLFTITTRETPYDYEQMTEAPIVTAVISDNEC